VVKRCSKCGESKPLEEFYKASTSKDGRRGDCKTCFSKRSAEWYVKNRDHVIDRVKRWQAENPDRVLATRQRRVRDPARERDQHLRRTFGISLEEYDGSLSSQDGRCAVCCEPPANGASLHVDHDHESGAIRGLLCFRCNGGLGQFFENHDRLLRAAEYVDGGGTSLAEAAGLAVLARERVGALVRVGVGESGH